MNILEVRKDGYTFQAKLNGSWDGGWGNIQYKVTIFLEDDIDGEGWMNIVASDSEKDVKENKGFNFKLLGVNIILEKVIIEYTFSSSYKNESYVKEYYHCSSNISRENLNYTNLEKAILFSNYGSGEAMSFDLFFDYSGEIIFSEAGISDEYKNGGYEGSIKDWPQQYKHYGDPVKWTLTNLNDKSNDTLKKVVHDLKREIVMNGSMGISNGYIGFTDIAKKAQHFYIGIDNKAREVIKIYVGDKNGKARLFYSNSGDNGFITNLEDSEFRLAFKVVSLNNLVYTIQGYGLPAYWHDRFENDFIFIPKENENSNGKQTIQIMNI